MMNLSTCTQARTPGEASDEVSLAKAIAMETVDSMSTEATGNEDLREKIGANDGTIPATSVQCFDFDDSMDISAWEWNRFLDFSPVDDQYPPDNES
jgi:hypothetical protein